MVVCMRLRISEIRMGSEINKKEYVVGNKKEYRSRQSFVHSLLLYLVEKVFYASTTHCSCIIKTAFNYTVHSFQVNIR